MARYAKPYSSLGITIIIVLYISFLIYCDVSSWWWDTLLCFPVGILYAFYPKLQKTNSPITLSVIICLFIICYKYIPINIVRTIGSPILCCLFIAYCSSMVRVPIKASVINFIGRNSLYMYFMEAIPIDYMVSEKTGIIIFVFGSIVISIVFTYIGKYVETHLLKFWLPLGLFTKIFLFPDFINMSSKLSFFVKKWLCVKCFSVKKRTFVKKVPFSGNPLPFYSRNSFSNVMHLYLHSFLFCWKQWAHSLFLIYFIGNEANADMYLCPTFHKMIFIRYTVEADAIIDNLTDRHGYEAKTELYETS